MVLEAIGGVILGLIIGYYWGYALCKEGKKSIFPPLNEIKKDNDGGED